MFGGFAAEALGFLESLAANNSVEWFERNRRAYETCVLEPMKELAFELADVVASIDPALDIPPRGGSAVSRIRRDALFSRNKPPYHESVWISFWDRSLPLQERRGFFFELSARSRRWGMGFYAASRAGMDGVRRLIDADPEAFLDAFLPAVRSGRFEVMGDAYRRSLAPHHGDDVRSVYDRKSFYLQRSEPNGRGVDGRRLVEDVTADFLGLAPLYRFIAGRGRMNPVRRA